MKKVVNVMLISSLVIGLVSCSGSKKEPNADELKAQLIEQISTKEKALKEKGYTPASVSELDEMVKLYKGFAQNNPLDEKTPEYLFKAAEMQGALGDYTGAIGTYESIVANYKDYLKCPEAQFAVGFIYENYLKQLGKAEEAYQKVVANYPKHKFSLEAKAAIENLGMSDEELIRKFEEMNKANS